jgi:hypothetical protein
LLAATSAAMTITALRIQLGSSRSTDPSASRPNDPDVAARAKGVVGDVRGLQQAVWRAQKGRRWGERNRPGLGDAVFGDDDFVAARGGVDESRQVRFGLVQVDRARRGGNLANIGFSVRLVDLSLLSSGIFSFSKETFLIITNYARLPIVGRLNPGVRRRAA